MNSPKISIVLSAIRTKWWGNLLASLESNTIDYEVIFVGDKNPYEEEWFKNLKDISNRKIYWLYCKERPSYCYQLGFNFAKGELINWSADDVEYSEKALDIAYNFHQIHSYPVVVAFNCIENGSPTSEGHTITSKGSPLMAPIGLMNRELLLKLGGYDKRFYCGQSENDLVMRVYEIGGRVEICKEATVYIEHNLKHEGKSIFRTEDGFEYHKQDRQFLESCWVLSNGEISKTRLKQFEPFEIK